MNGFAPDPYQDFLQALVKGQVINSPLPYVVQQALSTSQALAGIGTTAMGALAALQNGQQIPLVILPLARSRHT